MTATGVTASAPGKIILFGEHAVVYGHPALAVPVSQVQAHCRVEAASGSGLILQTPDLDEADIHIENAEAAALRQAENPLLTVLGLTLTELGQMQVPPLQVMVRSSIPIARGLGSGAAISTVMVRALAEFLGRPLPPARVSALVFEVEKRYHGTPSGIDNTVVAFAEPVFFQRGRPVERLQVGADLTLVIGDTGIVSPTYKAVGAVRAGWQADSAGYEAHFAAMAALAEQARQALEDGNRMAIGRAMTANHQHLQAIGVSNVALDTLVQAAEAAGALGAKLSGAGWGGNMIALVQPAAAEKVAAALRAAGAENTIITTIAATAA